MTNNDVLRRIRYAFDLGDSKMISMFGQAGVDVTRPQALLTRRRPREFELALAQKMILKRIHPGRCRALRWRHLNWCYR